MPAPNNSPFVIPSLICSKCGSNMRSDVHKYNTGQIKQMLFSCDTCAAAFELSPTYAVGMYIQYEAQKPEATSNPEHHKPTKKAS